MDRILDRLWLGDAQDANAYADPTTQHYPVRAILTLCEAKPCVHASVEHVHAPIPDEVFLPASAWGELLHCLGGLLGGTHRGHVLVHCRLGVSRSPALLAAYLAVCGHSRDPDWALAYILARRREIKPHPETMRGVYQYWEARDGAS